MAKSDIGYIPAFRYCPFCAAELLPNELFRESGAVYCPEHGDFFAHMQAAGRVPLVVFRHFDEGQRRTQTIGGRAKAKIICDQTGEIFANQADVCRRMGLPKGNLSAHMLGKRNARHVHGYTFTPYIQEG